MSTETPTLDRTREQLKSTEPDMTRIFLSIALNIKIKFFHLCRYDQKEFCSNSKVVLLLTRPSFRKSM